MCAPVCILCACAQLCTCAESVASRVFIYSGVTQSCYRSHDEKKENFVIKTIFEHEVFVYKYLHAANGAHKRDIAALGET